MRLPNAERAVVDIQKLTDYCLNPEHPRGRHKARIFKERLGITADNADFLRNAILNSVTNAEARETMADGFGRRFQVQFSVNTVMGNAIVRTGWIVLKGEEVPRLTTCFVA